MSVINENLTTEIRVQEAIERINARGEKVTNNSVKTELGGGSFSTISPIIKRWRESQRATTPTIVMPEHIKERGIQVLSMFYQECDEEAKQDNVKLKQHYENNMRDLETENDEQAKELIRLEEKLSDALKGLQEATNQVSDLAKRLHESEIVRVGEQTQRESAESLVNEYKTNWYSSREKEEKLRTDREKQAVLIGTYENTIDQLEKDNHQSRMHLKSLIDEKDDLQEQKKNVDKDYSKLLADFEQAIQTNYQLQATITDKDQAVTSLQSRITELETSLATATKDLTDFEENYSTSIQNLNTARDRIKQLATMTGEQKQELKDLNNELKALSKINGQLEQQIRDKESKKAGD